jgi:hypothetical protein
MKLEQADAVWLDARHEVSLAELVQFSRLSEAELRELVDYGAHTDRPQGAGWTFGADIVVTHGPQDACATTGSTPALALALTLISRIRGQAQLRLAPGCRAISLNPLQNT